MSTDMLQSKPLKSIIKFMLPILIGNVFQQLYSMVDTIIVGQTINNEALAGVGATSAMSFLVIGFVQGLTAGFSVLTSQRFGADDEKGVKQSVAITLLLSSAFTVVLTLASALTTMPLLKIMQTPEDIIQYSYDYIFIIYLGLGATFIYNIGASVMRAVGDSRTPLVFLIIASVINIALDLLFIMVFDMGVKGAAIATVISQLLSGGACLAYMFKKYPVLRIGRQDFKAAGKFYWKHLTVALPMAFQFSIIAIGIMVQQAALNTFGNAAVTAYTAANKIDNFCVQILIGLGMALAVFCGQNYGAGKMDRIFKGVNQTALLSFGFAIVIGLFVMFLAKPLTKIFVADTSGNILDLAQEYLFWQGVFYILLACIYVYRNALQGMGYSGFTVLACAVELGMRIVASLLFTREWGFTGVSLSNPTAWLGATLLLIPAYYAVILRKLKQSNADSKLSIAHSAPPKTIKHSKTPC